ncbi:MAG: GspE/PulE family protein [Patescibacteria group bacterium]|jgi:type IV pilus assembly protein PilB
MADSSSDDKNKKLSDKLSEIELKEKEKRVQTQADAMGISYINLEKFPLSQEALKIIEPEQAEALQTVCFLYTGEEMRLGSLNPSNPQVTNLAKELSEKYHTRIKIYLLSEASFNFAFAVYKKIPKIIQIEGVAISAEDIDKFDKKLTTIKDLNQLIQATDLTETINIVIAASLKFGASDIHIETEEAVINVRIRIDGILHEVATLKKDAWPKLSSRLKLLAGLKLNIGNKPQDGRFTIHLTKDQIEVRVSSIPSAYGESIVMRLLKASAVGLEFEQLGFRGKSFNILNEEMKKPNGMIITTGPTGSGKTTTLYAILNKLNKPDTKIITLEDPIEYKLLGIVQSQIDNTDASDQEDVQTGEIKKKSTYTFARGLRAILRQDPDIVMVGEIRDLETAETAVNAALTGHLMLSTIHTNSAAGTIPRLLSMGVQAFLLAPSLNAIIGQRLTRKLCQNCKTEDTSLDNATMTVILNTLNEISPQSGYKPDLNNLKFYTAKGCDKCQGIGYKGRIGIYEVMLMSPEIEKIILSDKASEYEIEKIAVKDGMITMFQDGLLKALDGLTSIEEIFDHVKD